MRRCWACSATAPTSRGASAIRRRGSRVRPPGDDREPRTAVTPSIDLWWLPDALPLVSCSLRSRRSLRLLGTAYGLFVAGNIAPPLLRHGLMSLGRFSSVMFPGVRLAGVAGARPRADLADHRLRARSGSAGGALLHLAPDV